MLKDSNELSSLSRVNRNYGKIQMGEYYKGMIHMELLYSRLWALSKVVYKKNVVKILKELDYKFGCESFYLKYCDKADHVEQKVVLLVYENDIYISFAGTDVFNGLHGMYDWANNFKLIPMKNKFGSKQGRVHLGFMRSLELTLHKQPHTNIPSILDILDRLVNDYDGTIYLTGHSKGGALAILFASLVKEKYPDREIDVITYGAPKAGDKYFVREIDDYIGDKFSYTRFINVRDISSDFPSKYFGYHHTGKLIKMYPRIKRIPYYPNQLRLNPSVAKKVQLFLTDFKSTHFKVYNQLLDMNDPLTRALNGHVSENKVL